MKDVVVDQKPGDDYLWVYIVKAGRKGGPNKQLLLDEGQAEKLYYRLKKRYGPGSAKRKKCRYCGSPMETTTNCTSQRCTSR